jgi:hypothetical protein
MVTRHLLSDELLQVWNSSVRDERPLLNLQPQLRHAPCLYSNSQRDRAVHVSQLNGVAMVPSFSE